MSQQIQIIYGGSVHHAKSIKQFAVLMIVVEVIIIVLYGVFVRIEHTPGDTYNAEKYPAYQDVNVMMLIGFGYLMAFSKTTSWSAFSYTFFMNALMVQLYVLVNGFWYRVFHGFSSDNFYIFVKQETFTLGLYSAASMFINIGCNIGRTGPLDILIMCLVHEVGYCLNEIIVLETIKAFDVGGSMTIHTFGAVGGLTISMLITSIVRPQKDPVTSYNSVVFAFLGTLFLYMFWPSFNFGVLATTPFMKTQIITNTILSLTGSCLATFMTSAFLAKKFDMEHLLNATISGGVIIGAPAGILYNPGAALLIGFIGGIISTLGFEYLSPYLKEKFGLYDTCGVNNLHGIPGMLGGIISAICCAVYIYPSSLDAFTLTSVEFPYLTTLLSTPYKQGGLQIAGTFTSAGIGIVTGLVSGCIIRQFYSFREQQFFFDGVYFNEAQQFLRGEEDIDQKVVQKGQGKKITIRNQNIKKLQGDIANMLNL